MSKPRPYEPGTTYHITRRVTERTFYLRPDQQTANTFLYALALYAARHEVLVHAFVIMSNHVHLVVTDQHGNIPDFTRDLFATTARALNTKLARRENFWASGKGGLQKLISDETVVQKIAYTLTNPVNAGVVTQHERWRLNDANTRAPLLSTLADIRKNRTFTAERPSFYFKQHGHTAPATASFTLTTPPAIAPSDYIYALEQAVREREKTIGMERQALSKAFLGMKRALRADIHTKPASKESTPTINPLVACSDTHLLAEELIRIKEFRKAHRRCMEEWRKGNRDIPFPTGTYTMRKLHRVTTAPLELVLRNLTAT